MGFFIHNYQRFSGSASELADLAITCSRHLSLPGDTSKISERLIRYYVTEGLLSRPTRIGRDAEYGYKHLLQFLASRSLMEEGYPMQKVADYISNLDISQLEPLALNQTKPNLAELLVASFKHPEKTPRSIRSKADFLPSSPMGSIPMMSLGGDANRLDKSKRSVSSFDAESYREGMKRTGVINTRELVSDLKLDITEVKTMMSEVFNSIATVAQPAATQLPKDMQENFERLRCDLSNFCQKIDESVHVLIDKQSLLLKETLIRNEDFAHRQQLHIERLEQMILQLKDEIRSQK